MDEKDLSSGPWATLLQGAVADSLLDEAERRAFETAFAAAPPEVQELVRNAQMRRPRIEELLPNPTIPESLRQRVLAAVRHATVPATDAERAEKARRESLLSKFEKKTEKRTYFLFLRTTYNKFDVYISTSAFPASTIWPKSINRIGLNVETAYQTEASMRRPAGEVKSIAVAIRSSVQDEDKYLNEIANQADQFRDLVRSTIGSDSESAWHSVLAPRGEYAGQVDIRVIPVRDAIEAWNWYLNVEQESEFGDITSRVKGAIAAMPDGYEIRKNGIGRLASCVNSEIAKAIGPALNARAAEFPHSTYEEKKLLSKWVNAEIRSYPGLAIRCPKTGRPAYLAVDTGGKPGMGRFQLEVVLEDGRVSRTVNSPTLPVLELMVEPQTTQSERGPSRHR